LAGAIGEALDAFQFRDAWTERMQRGMAKDYSWEASAAEYQRMYAELASQ
jgi:starch synthase